MDFFVKSCGRFYNFGPFWDHFWAPNFRLGKKTQTKFKRPCKKYGFKNILQFDTAKLLTKLKNG